MLISVFMNHIMNQVIKITQNAFKNDLKLCWKYTDISCYNK